MIDLDAIRERQTLFNKRFDRDAVDPHAAEDRRVLLARVAELERALRELRDAGVRAGARMVVVDANAQQTTAFTRLCNAIDKADAALEADRD